MIKIAGRELFPPIDTYKQLVEALEDYDRRIKNPEISQDAKTKRDEESPEEQNHEYDGWILENILEIRTAVELANPASLLMVDIFNNIPASWPALRAEEQFAARVAARTTERAARIAADEGVKGVLAITGGELTEHEHQCIVMDAVSSAVEGSNTSPALPSEEVGATEPSKKIRSDQHDIE